MKISDTMENKSNARGTIYKTVPTTKKIFTNKQQTILNEQINRSKKIIPTALVTITALLALAYLRLNTFALAALLTIINAIITKTKDPLTIGKQLLLNTAFLLLFKIINYLTGGHGLIGITIGVLIITGLLIYRRWEAYIAAKETIETFIWGAPLLHKKGTKKLNTQQPKRQTNGARRAANKNRKRIQKRPLQQMQNNNHRRATTMRL